MRTKRPTIRCVAAAAGVSTATVSHVLNEREANRYSAATRRQVLDAARRLNYRLQPSKRGAGNSGRRTWRVAFVHHGRIESAMDPFAPVHAVEMHAIERMTRKFQAQVTFFTGDTDTPVPSERILDSPWDGVILSGLPPAELVEGLTESGIPLILMGDWFTTDAVNSVRGDGHQGGELAARHLLDFGHRRIGFVGETHDMPFLTKRLGGVMQALFDAGIEFKQEWQCLTERTDLNAWLDTALTGDQPLTALVAGTWSTGLELLAVLRERGSEIPGQVSLVVFDNLPVCETAIPALTCIEEPIAQIAELSMAKLAFRIEHPQVPPSVSRLPCKLITRQSTAPPKQAFCEVRNVAGKPKARSTRHENKSK